MKSSSFFTEHPWMTLILGLAVVNGAVIAARGYAPAPQLHAAAKVSGERGCYR